MASPLKKEPSEERIDMEEDQWPYTAALGHPDYETASKSDSEDEENRVSQNSFGILSGGRPVRLVLYDRHQEDNTRTIWVDFESTYSDVANELTEIVANRTFVMLEPIWGPLPCWIEANPDSLIGTACHTLYVILQSESVGYILGVVRTSLSDYPIAIFEGPLDPSATVSEAVVASHPKLSDQIKSITGFTDDQIIKDTQGGYDSLRQYASSRASVVIMTVDEPPTQFMSDLPDESIPPLLQVSFAYCKCLMQWGHDQDFFALQTIHLLRAILHTIISLALRMEKFFEEDTPDIETALHADDDIADLLRVTPLVSHELQTLLRKLNGVMETLEGGKFDADDIQKRLDNAFDSVCADYPGAVTTRRSYGLFKRLGRMDHEEMHVIFARKKSETNRQSAGPSFASGLSGETESPEVSWAPISGDNEHRQPRTTAPFSSTGTSLKSSLPAPDLNAPKIQDLQAKARSRIGEIRRLAEEKQRADRVQTIRVYHPMVIDDSEEEEEEDPLEKLIPPPKIPPTAKPKAKPASARRKRAGSPLPVNIFDSISPLTGSDSDDRSMNEPSTRSTLPNITTRSSSRAAPQVPEIPTPTRTRTRANLKAPILPPPPRSRASSKPTTIPAPAARSRGIPAKAAPTLAHSTSVMPSSLASLLEESPSAYRRPDDDTTRELMRAVKQDMLNIEQRHFYGDVVGSEPLENSRRIDPSVTEMALGEEEGRKMNEVLASDNSPATQISPWRPFWDEQLVEARDVSMEIDYQIPPLLLSKISHPVLAHLQKLVASKYNTYLGPFLSSGILSAIPPNTEDGSLVPWLFMLACEAPDHIANAAQQLLRERLSSQAKFHLDCHQLVLSHLMDPILSLDPLAEAIEPLRCSAAAISSPRNPITRSVVVSRLVGIIRMTSKDIIPQSPEGLVLLLLLLYLDPSTPSDVRRDISLVVEDIIVSITSHPDDSQRMKALIVCKKITEITAKFRVVEKRMLLDCIFGGQPGPRNFMRWVAVGFLLPEAVQALNWTEYLKPPPLGPFAEMLTPGHISTSHFRIWPKTDYHDLHNHTDILGTILTDIGLYGAKEDRNLERILNGLLHIQGKIVDGSPAFIEHTRAKDALQRLRLRVHFQFERTMKPTRTATTIDTMLKR